MKLVEQNKEVFINGKTLYQAFVDMAKSINNQQIPKEGILTRDLSVSSRSLTPDSNGYFSPGSTSKPYSRKGSLSTNSEDETFESGTFDDEEVRKQGKGLGDETEELKSKIEELERETELLKKQNAELESRNKKITEEGEKKVSELIEKNQAWEKEFVRLKVELERETKELTGKDQKIEQLKQEVGTLEQSQRDKNAKIAELKDRLEGEKSKAQSTR
ncbi:coiled-coil domain-containing protein [Wolbachia pipientis]|uniref:hypothetical protein n=1 Tax=Wolbachia pipientis TaxID=955 RepID=UPI0025A39164|nr:hypothetical protein [Wolbachia pipientis]MDM8334819.1 hypothetical protein [Wolbachia pipientis]